MASSRPSKRPKVEDDSSSMFSTAEEEEEALRYARIAARAEAKARGGAVKGEPEDLEARLQRKKPAANAKQSDAVDVKPKFMTKAEREQAALERLKQRRGATQSHVSGHTHTYPPHAAHRTQHSNAHASQAHSSRAGVGSSSSSSSSGGVAMSDKSKEKELQMIREQYLGKKVQKKKVIKPSEKFAKIFQFDWEAGDDTSTDLNPLYNQKMKINPLFGRGYIAGVDLQEQRKTNAFNKSLIEKRQEEERRAELKDATLSKSDIRDRERERRRVAAELQEAEDQRTQRLEKSSIGLRGKHWKDKALDEMDERDWRIFREDFDIVVRGGRVPLPLRSWKEGNIPEPVLHAIHDLKYIDPSPIQRQAIPVGLEWRDIIGIAETGSGKTCAFVVPMLSYIMSLPENRRERLAEEGPLAMIMAPTRELAQQIEVECRRLCVHLGYNTVSVVGGQSIQDQGFRLRQGVEIVIGTPGRLKDSLENRYLVLNQCSYVVLDEADRMVDMGFEADLQYVLESMGGLLKSEAEEEAYAQEERARRGEAVFRVTAMFSATMPPEVERIAKTYLRHPAIVSIGDRDSGKNMRITQVVVMISDGQKSQRLLREATPANSEEKIIVFVNEKKRCDYVARTLGNAGVRASVLHGGKTQDQREESLDMFRQGAIQVLVATDVAGRGLDIPDVAKVVNFDMPKHIEPYCHRIGRTGRAGKDGRAVTFLTEADEEVFYDLKEYLQQTDSDIPPQLMRHPAAQHPPGARREDGRPAARRRDTVIHAK